MRRRNVVLLSVTIVIAMLSIGFLGYKTLLRSIYQSHSCEWANIDNIELRTLMDIPATSGCDCVYDETADTKTVIFNLDLEAADIIRYATTNGFKAVDTPEEIEFSALETRGNLNFASAKLWQKNGLRENEESFRMLLDPESKQLFISLKYLN